MTGGSDDYIYENAPLVEVIAELRWHLLPIESMPGAEIDPIYDRALPKVRDALAGMGLKHVDQLVPEHVPQEMIAGLPAFRFRPAANRWPLVQLGPGVMTVNVTPPYEGWGEFAVTLEGAIRAVDATFSFGEQFSRIKSLELRYLDAFTAKHGLGDHIEFIRDDLSLTIQPPDALIGALKEPDANVYPGVNLQFPVRGRPYDQMLLSASRGARDGREALIYDLRVRHHTPEHVLERGEDVIKWMHDAHRILNIAFERTISDRLRAVMGPKRAVRERT